MAMATIENTHEPLWQNRARRLLQAEQARDRIEAYTLLCTKCTESKLSQRSVGAFLQGPISNEPLPDHRQKLAPRILLSKVLDDLHSSDRTIRIGAARVLCHIAYQNMQDQEAIIIQQQSATVTNEESVQFWSGATIGWLYVFSVPESVYQQYHPSTTPANISPDATSFIRKMVATNYALVYTTVSEFYTSKCQSNLPFCWSAPVNSIGGFGAAANSFTPRDITDPNEYILGFYLAPREKHIPESDLALSREFSLSISTPEDLAQLNTTIEGWSSPIRNSGDHNFRLIATCVEIHLKSLTSRFGTDMVQLVRSIFDSVAFKTESYSTNAQVCYPNDATEAEETDIFAWEPVLIGTILRNPAVPSNIKLPLARLQPNQQLPIDVCDICSRFVRPDQAAARFRNCEHWQYIVPVLPQDICPISWLLFITKWRQVADTFEAQNAHNDVGRRASSSGICSISSIRKSILATDASSYRNLDQLRNDLPGIFRSQQIPNRATAIITNTSRDDTNQGLTSLAELEYCHCPLVPNDCDGSNSGSDDSDILAPTLRHFRVMNAMSTAGLDEISKLRMQERSETNSERVQRNLCRQIEIATREKMRKSKQIDIKHGQAELNIKSLEAQRVQNRQSMAQRLDTKQQRAKWRRLQQQQIDEAWQRGIRERLATQSAAISYQQQQQRNHQPARPITPRQPKPTPTKQFPQRPRSARDPSKPPAPELARERATIYAEAIRAASSTLEDSAPSQPPQVDKRFSTFRASSFLQKLASNDAPPPRRRISLARYTPPRQAKSSGTDRKLQQIAEDRNRSLAEADTDQLSQAAPENACATLVMQQAAQKVAQRVSIPRVEPPRVAEPHVPPYVVLAQYQSLDEPEKNKFRSRFGLQRVRHQLSFELLRQFTRLARRDYAWRAFHERASSSSGAIKYPEFVDIAHHLGVPQSAKQLLRLARKLDDHKTGWIDWKSFYTWWCLQFDPDFVDVLDEDEDAIEEADREES